MPIFTPHQDAALTAASNWLKGARRRASIFRLFGYAGTGKTTLAKHLAEGVDGKVLFAAFTGKAACVMRSKGLPGRRHHPQPDLQGARKRRGDAELRAVGRGARLQG
jgi:predicted ATPase